MAKQTEKISKTERLLSVCHLIKHCNEVSMKELTDILPGCKKTFSRDIALLKKAGYDIRYSAKQQAFVLAGYELKEPDYSGSKFEQKYIDKIRRLTLAMSEMPYEDPDLWYKGTFPGVSRRTMQRDFATLNAIGYRIKYKREWEDPEYKDDDKPPGHYYNDNEVSCNTYSLSTFRNVF